jgi:hypothetical protein
MLAKGDFRKCTDNKKGKNESIHFLGILVEQSAQVKVKLLK